MDIVKNILIVYVLLLVIIISDFSHEKFINYTIKTMLILSLGLVIYWFEYKSLKNQINDDKAIYPSNNAPLFVTEIKDWEFYKPYSWIWPIPKEILFVENNSSFRIDSQYYVTKYFHLIKGSDKPKVGCVVIDFVNKKHVDVSESIYNDPSIIKNVKNLNFVENDDNWIYTALDTFTHNLVKPYFVHNMFGEEMEITSLISLGFYYFENNRLMNKDPY